MDPNKTQPIKDSGTRRSFATGSVRDARAGKGRFDLLPFRGLMRLARHFEAGAEKYRERNWEKGLPLSVFADSGLRHGHKASAGFTDEDHVAAAAWNWLCLADTQERIKEGLLPAELDDLPKPATPVHSYLALASAHPVCGKCGRRGTGAGVWCAAFVEPQDPHEPKACLYYKDS